MEKMIHEYLNLLGESNKDFLFDSDKRKDLIDFANSINKLRRFSLSVNVSGRLRIHIENNNCTCDINLDIKKSKITQKIYILIA